MSIKYRTEDQPFPSIRLRHLQPPWSQSHRRTPYHQSCPWRCVNIILLIFKPLTLEVRITNDEDRWVPCRAFDERCAQTARSSSMVVSCNEIDFSDYTNGNNLTWAWEAKAASPSLENAFDQGLDDAPLRIEQGYSCGKKTYSTSFGMFLPINKGNEGVRRGRDTWTNHQVCITNLKVEA